MDIQSHCKRCSSMLLEILYLALMLLCFLKRVERAEIASFPCGFALLSRIQAIFAGFEFTDHNWWMQRGGQVPPGKLESTLSPAA